MAHRVFRLSISPERAPEVRRVVDFDGRATLHDVHAAIQRTLELDNDHLYAFYLSGKYFDRASEYGIAEDSRHDSSRTLLFRLGLTVGQRLAYLFDFGDEHRHTVQVVAITDVEAPLGEPVVVETVGAAPAQYDGDGELGPYELPEYLTELQPLAEAVLTLSERLDVLYEQDDAEHAAGDDDDESAPNGALRGPPEAIVSLLGEVSKAALELAAALQEDEDALLELDEWSGERELLPRLVELPLALVAVGQLDRALAAARAFTFVAPESGNGDVAIILAEAGERDAALAQLGINQEQYPDSFLTALKAGAAYEALGDAAAAEASYRRALALAQGADEEEEGLSQLIGFLEDAGRSEEAEVLRSPRESPR